jgi:hypothetical protein
MIAEAEEEARNIGTEMVHVRGYTNYGVALAARMIIDDIVIDPTTGVRNLPGQRFFASAAANHSTLSSLAQRLPLF